MMSLLLSPTPNIYRLYVNRLKTSHIMSCGVKIQLLEDLGRN